MNKVSASSPLWLLRRFLNIFFDTANNCININKSVHCFQIYAFFSFLQNIGSNNFTRLYSSLVFTHKTSHESQKTHTPYAGTEILQTLCVGCVLRSGLTKDTCNPGRTNFACNIVHVHVSLYTVQVKKNPHFLFFSMINCLFFWEKLGEIVENFSRFLQEIQFFSPGNTCISP